MFGFKRLTVYDYQSAVKYEYGKLVGTLDPGRHLIRTATTDVRTIDRRDLLINVPGQEVLTADSVTIRISLIAEYRVVDPIAAVQQSSHYEGSLYAALQVALRGIVGELTIEELLANRSKIDESIVSTVSEQLKSIGLELIRANVKDIMFPGELKNTFAQVATAKQEGLAALERARGESAALRNLANSAGLFKDHPQLMQLRLLQEISASSEPTFIVGDSGFSESKIPKKKK